ncbi:MAG: WD40/YVTN/BNR-like repeat-containing protein [Thermoanaerobaculia bacterium]
MRFWLSAPLCALLAALPLAAAAPRGTPGAWYRYPLPGAEVKSLVADPALPGVFWAGTAQGGIYRSADGGTSWTSPPGGAPFPGYAVTSLASDPAQPGAVWAGLTGVVKGGLLVRSTDLGRSFEVVRRWDDRAGARVVAVASRRGRKVVGVGGDWGVEISEDDGETWRVSAPPLDPGSGVSFLAFDPVRPGVLYCGSFRHPFRSVDDGQTWARIANGMVEDTEIFEIDFSPDDPNDFWAATCGWVYRTKDGGASWTRYRDGLSDRRTQAVRVDPRDANRLLAGTTGGVFESRDRGVSFRRISADVVVNALVFDPHDPSRLLVGTEADGVLRSEDGGATLVESNRGLSEARVSAVALLPSGRVVVARAADGKSGGLWTVEAATGDVERLEASPPATVLSLASAGDALLAGAPDGIYRAARAGAPFAKVLPVGTRAFASDGDGRYLAATNAGVYESTNGGNTWRRLGSLRSRVEDVRRARFPEGGLKTWSADTEGLTLWWDGTEWARRPLPGGKLLTGGFGRPRAPAQFVPEPVGVALSAERSVLVFRPEDDVNGGIAVMMPETGLVVAGWAGDPRTASGLYLATMGRGLFRFVPGTGALAAADIPAAVR